MDQPRNARNGLADLAGAGFNERQIRRIIFLRRYHREHPDDLARCRPGREHRTYEAEA